MAKDFARGEQMMRRPDPQQEQQSDVAPLKKSPQQPNRSLPSWSNRGAAWEAWEGDTPPPIPEHLKSNAWMKRLPGETSSKQEGSSSGLAAKSDAEKTTLLADGSNPKAQQPKVPVSKRPYGDKLVDAAKMVPDLLKGDAKAAYQKMISDPAFVGQLVAVSAVFAAVQFTPAGPFVNGALLATLGLSAGFDLYNFLTKVGGAKDENGLKDAAGYLKSLVETIGIAAVAGSLRTASRALGAIKADTSTAAVWKAIKGTQPVYKGTLIPRSFELQVGNKKVWVAPNATDHFRELVEGFIRSRGSNKNADKYTQFLLEDFRNTVSQATQKIKIPKFGDKNRQNIKIGNWDLVFGSPRNPGELPVILHAQPIKNIYVP